MSKIISLLGVVLTLFAVDSASAVTALPDGTPSWTLSGDPTVAKLTPSADGKSATLVPMGAAGSVTVVVTLGSFSKTDTFEFDAVAPPAPAPAPAPGPAVAIDWTVTPITAAAPAPSDGSSSDASASGGDGTAAS